MGDSIGNMSSFSIYLFFMLYLQGLGCIYVYVYRLIQEYSELTRNGTSQYLCSAPVKVKTVTGKLTQELRKKII